MVNHLVWAYRSRPGEVASMSGIIEDTVFGIGAVNDCSLVDHLVALVPISTVNMSYEEETMNRKTNKLTLLAAFTTFLVSPLFAAPPLTEPVDVVVTEPVEAVVSNAIPFDRLVSLTSGSTAASPGVTVIGGNIQESGKLHAVSLSLSPENPGELCGATFSLVVKNDAANTTIEKTIGGLVTNEQNNGVLEYNFASPIEFILSTDDVLYLYAKLFGTATVCNIQMGGVYEAAE